MFVLVYLYLFLVCQARVTQTAWATALLLPRCGMCETKRSAGNNQALTLVQHGFHRLRRTLRPASALRASTQERGGTTVSVTLGERVPVDTIKPRGGRGKRAEAERAPNEQQR